MTLNPVPIPLQDIIATQPREEYLQKKELDPRAGFLTEPWIRYFTDLALTSSEQARRIENKSYTAQAASIAVTNLLDAALATGIYRVSWYAGISRVDGVSSSLTVKLNWNDGVTAAKAFTFPAITANLTTTAESGTHLMLVSAATPISFETTYASNTPGQMLYNLGLTLERVQA